MDYPSRSFNETYYPRLASFREDGLSPTPDYLQRFSFTSPNLDYYATLARAKISGSPALQNEEKPSSPSIFYRPLFLADNRPHCVSDFQLHPVHCSPSSTISKADSHLDFSLKSAKHRETSRAPERCYDSDGTILWKPKIEGTCGSEKHSTPFLTLSDILNDSLLDETDFLVETEDSLVYPMDGQDLHQQLPVYPTSTFHESHFCRSDGAGTELPSPVISDVLLTDSTTEISGSMTSARYLQRMDHEEIVFVRPQDVMGEQPPSIDDLYIKSEEQDTMDQDVMEFVYPQHSPPPEGVPNIPEERQLPTLTNDQLCEVVDYFFRHIHAPKIENPELLIEPQTITLGNLHEPVLQPMSSSLHNQSSNVKVENIDSTLLTGQSTLDTRVVLADRTNSSRTRPLLGVLEDFDDVMPFDINLLRSYEGVTHEAVAQKTKYYKMMNPGQKLSDDLLFSFAGRLSERGETILGYRCYISGCRKATKRKDHMGDHIRTHLGEKPFQCSIW